MNKDKHKKKIGIIGFPLGHSLSPDMHNHIYKTLSFDSYYDRWEIEEKNLSTEFEKITQGNFLGANVTVPYKEKIIPFLDFLNEESKITGAVNTIAKQNDKLVGFNTDIFGIESCLNNQFGDTNLNNVVLIGSGGAARAALYVLLNKGIDNLTIINRTKSNVEKMLKRFSKFDCNYEILNFSDKNKVKIKSIESELIINTTTFGMKGSGMELISPIDQDCISGKSVIFDLVYNPRITKLMSMAISKNADIIEGIDMLVYQASKSIELWTGLTPSFEEMKNKCLELLKK